jgi:hypothetical protein
VYRLLNPLSFVAFKMGRLPDGPCRTGAKGAYLDRYVISLNEALVRFSLDRLYILKGRCPGNSFQPLLHLDP